MNLKNSLLILTFLFGCIFATQAYPDYEEEASDQASLQTRDVSAGDNPQNEDIYDPGSLQQEIEASDRKYDVSLDNMDMDSETEVSLKSVRNISNNQLSNEYISLEHDHEDSGDQEVVEDDQVEEEEHNTSMALQSTEQNSNESKVPEEEENDTEDPLSKKSRMGRLLITTTTVPEYIRTKTKASDEQNLTKEDVNLSTSDYVEDEGAKANDLVHIARRKALKQVLARKQEDENEDIVPQAMKYYDDIPQDNTSAVSLQEDEEKAEADVSENASEDIKSANKLQNKEPVPLPQQQLLPRDPPQQQQPRQQHSKQLHQQNISSEEYYEDEEYHEDESSATTKASSPTTTARQMSDNNIIKALFGGFPFNYNPTTTVPPSATPAAPITTQSNNPINEPFDSSFVTTSAPQQPLNGLMMGNNGIASAAAAAAAASIPGDKKAKQIPIITTTTTTTTKTTPSAAVAPAPASATSSRRRLLPHEQLRNYIEDAYIRMPLAVIVDPSAESLEKTKALWNDAMRTNLNIKIVLVTLNESEESPASFNFNNTRQFLTGLNSIKEQKSGDAFRGISHAAELVPYDSAVFISTAKLADHTDQVQDSAITLLKKRIRLYLIWFGERSLSENETQDSVGGILGEVAIRSGGEVLHIVGSENSQELEGSTLTIVADALRGSQEVDVPVDTTLSSLHVKIDKLMRRAVLDTPNGEINLKKLVKFKSHLLTRIDDDTRLDAYVPLTKLRKATVYKLKMIPDDLNTEYSVFIRGERKADTFLDDMIKHFENYFYEGQTSYPKRLRNSKLQSLTSALAIATMPTHSKIQFQDDGDQRKSQPKNDVETFSTKEIHGSSMDSTTTTHTNSSLPLADTTTALNQRNTNILQRTNTKIEMGTQSQILIAPGMIGQLYFEVTNTGYEAIYYNIQVVDERRYLMRLAPQSLFLRAGQMSTVTVTVLVPQNTVGETIDHITFSTTGTGTTTSLTLNLKVITTIDSQDNTAPSVSWTFGSRCEYVDADSSTCSERFWNMYISAQDWQTGIMRLQTTPSAGLIYTRSYTIGTTEPLKATYVASCCEPRVALVAYDVAGNQRSYTVDVRDIVLTEASIAAISLGAILLVLLIILLIAAIVWCCRRRKIVLDLPTYRSHSTRSME